ncbi:MAG: flavodoxin domain-containing protein [Rhizobiaceae bacterium]
MNILLLYGSTEGHTRKIAEYCENYLVNNGHTVEVRKSKQRSSDLDIANFDGVILAGSVHQKRHQETLENFVFAHREQLKKLPTLLISVSLSIAFENGKEEASRYVELLIENTKFKPDCVALVGGALKFEMYGYYMSHIVEHVVLKDREKISEDREFTDWDDLRLKLDAFTAGM